VNGDALFLPLRYNKGRSRRDQVLSHNATYARVLNRCVQRTQNADHATCGNGPWAWSCMYKRGVNNATRAMCHALITTSLTGANPRDESRRDTFVPLGVIIRGSGDPETMREYLRTRFSGPTTTL
jgi:hypothetical protein